MNKPATLLVTDSAYKKASEAIKSANLGRGYYIRVVVEVGGCRGMSYSFEIDKKHSEDIVIKHKNKILFVVNNDCIVPISGSTIDFINGEFGGKFVIVGNPNAKSCCGCGSSFEV